MNVKVGSKETEGVAGKWGVNGANKIRQQFVDVCAEGGVVFGEFLLHKMIYRYFWA